MYMLVTPLIFDKNGAVVVAKPIQSIYAYVESIIDPLWRLNAVV